MHASLLLAHRAHPDPQKVNTRKVRNTRAQVWCQDAVSGMCRPVSAVGHSRSASRCRSSVSRPPNAELKVWVTESVQLALDLSGLKHGGLKDTKIQRYPLLRCKAPQFAPSSNSPVMCTTASPLQKVTGLQPETRGHSGFDDNAHARVVQAACIRSRFSSASGATLTVRHSSPGSDWKASAARNS